MLWPGSSTTTGAMASQETRMSSAGYSGGDRRASRSTFGGRWPRAHRVNALYPGEAAPPYPSIPIASAARLKFVDGWRAAGSDPLSWSRRRVRSGRSILR